MHINCIFVLCLPRAFLFQFTSAVQELQKGFHDLSENLTHRNQVPITTTFSTPQFGTPLALQTLPQPFQAAQPQLLMPQFGAQGPMLGGIEYVAVPVYRNPSPRFF